MPSNNYCYFQLTSIRPPERAVEIELIDEKGEERDFALVHFCIRKKISPVSVHLKDPQRKTSTVFNNLLKMFQSDYEF